MLSEKQRQIGEAIEPTINSMGFDYVGCEVLSQGRHSVLRVFIDKKDGVSSEDCAEVSIQISGVLDVEDLIKTRYNLEVSSPGLDRPLFTLEQFMTALGQQVKVRLTSPLNGRRNFDGTLKSIVDENILVEVEEETFTLPYAAVAKANIVYQF